MFSTVKCTSSKGKYSTWKETIATCGIFNLQEPLNELTESSYEAIFPDSTFVTHQMACLSLFRENEEDARVGIG